MLLQRDKVETEAGRGLGGNVGSRLEVLVAY